MTSKKQASPRSVSDIDRHVGERLRLRRNMVGMSQEKLALTEGITFQQVQKYEKGTNRVSIGRLYSMARTLGVDIGYFVEGFDEEAVEEMGDLDPDERVASLMRSQFGIKLGRAVAEIESAGVRNQILDMARALKGR